MAGNQPGNVDPILRDFITPSGHKFESSVKRSTIKVDFEKMRTLIQMVQQSQFSGSAIEDPTAHLTGFLNICGTFDIDEGSSSDDIKLHLFPFSLKDKARAWLDAMLPVSFDNWKDLSKAFLQKYFPPVKTIKLRTDIITFCQREEESLYEAWERYKALQRQCPHHELPDWLLIHTFYNGLSHSLRNTIDVAAGGSLMGKTAKQAHDLFDQMAWNTYQWSSERVTRRSPCVFEVDPLSMMNAKFEALNEKLDKISMNVVETSSSPCHFDGGGLLSTGYQLGNSFSQKHYKELMNFVNNDFNQRPQGNPYSNNYNPSLMSHLNFSRSNQLNQGHQELKFSLDPLMENFLMAQKQQDEAINKLISKVDHLSTHNKFLEKQIAQQACSSSRAYHKLCLD